MSKLYSSSDEKRRVTETPSERLSPERYRSEWRRDYSRVLHSPCFRRLQGKNQLLPSTDSDFFRNRLTHSLEVAQIAKSIAIRLNEEFIQDPNWIIDPTICETAALAHDLGHPPFGHQGEDALNRLMIGYGGFEGNAQTFRIISKLEKKSQSTTCVNDISRFGLNLTSRVLASTVKYDKAIPREILTLEKHKGIYHSDLHVLEEIKSNLGLDAGKVLYTIEAQIMDISDDIAYSTYDLEDAFKAGFLSPLSICFPSDTMLELICSELSKFTGQAIGYPEYVELVQELFGEVLPAGPSSSTFEDVLMAYNTSKLIQEDGYFRTRLTSYLVGKFIRGVTMGAMNTNNPSLSTIAVDPDIRLRIELLKKITLYSIIESPKMHARNDQANKMITNMFDALCNNHKLMPDDVYSIFKTCHEVNDNLGYRVICDFISGMTDKYAFNFYKSIFYPSNKSFFEPHW